MQKLTFNSGCYPGPYFALAMAIAQIANDSLSNIDIQVHPIVSSIISSTMIGSGEAALGLVRNDIAFFALTGQKPIFNKSIPKIRGIASLYRECVQIVARKDSNIASIIDLRGKRIAVGPKGSAEELCAQQILEAYDMTFKNMAEVKHYTVEQSCSSLTAKEIDCFFYTIGSGYAPIKRAASKTETSLVPIDGIQAELLVAKFPYYVEDKLPGGVYDGIEEPVPVLSIMTMLATTSDLDDGVVYQITKALFSNPETMAWAHDLGKQIKFEDALQGMAISVHPGSERYYNDYKLHAKQSFPQ